MALGFALMVCIGCKRSEPLQTCTRTVLVYMIASNDLGQNGYSDSDLAEMAVGIKYLPDDCRWLVYMASPDRNVDAQLFEITRNGRKTLETYQQGTSATSSRMNQVMTHMRQHAPAKSYGLVMWSHASGWQMDGADDDPGISPLSVGMDFGQRMNVNTLRSVLAVNPFDYIYFDACYMATVEVAYELRDVVPIIVGSPSELPADGMPYDQNVKWLAKGSLDDLRTAASNTFNHYNSLPSAYDRTCTMAVIRTEPIVRLANATKAIYAQTPLPHPGNNVTNYRGTSRQGPSIDFGEYVNALASSKHLSNELVSEFNNALTSAVVYHAATDKLWNIWPMYSSSGLATYVFNLASSFDNYGYSRLAWAQDVVSYHLNN